MQSSPFALNIKKNKGRLECRLNNPKSMMIPTDNSFKIDKDTEKGIFRSYKEILRIAKEDESNPNFEKELRKLGDGIWNGILSEVFEKFDLGPFEGSDIAFELSESTIDFPWELALCKKKPYTHLCEMVNIGRKRDIVYNDGFRNALSPGKELKKTEKSALVVGLNDDGTNKKLDLAEKEAERIADFLEKNGVSVKPLIGPNATRTSVINELKRGVNIFHFTGHGSKGKDQCEIFLSNKETLNADDFMQELGTRLAPTLSFINACETTVERHTVGESKERYSWAYAMAGIGGRACVGTLWAINEGGALKFASDFYHKFFKGKTIGASVREARHLLKAKDENNEVWPAYILYAPPTLLVDDILEPNSPIEFK
jgi:hypothetical protein